VNGSELFYREAGDRSHLPDAEIHLLPTGHFATATHSAGIAELIIEFAVARVPVA
jgi:hypothetical protein